MKLNHRTMMFDLGIRPVIDKYLEGEAAKVRNYGEYWSASSSGYCMRKNIMERLGVPAVSDDARKTRVFASGHIFHEWIQRITKNSGLSIAQELELQDEELMIRGHIDDLILVASGGGVINDETIAKVNADTHTLSINGNKARPNHLILYDYKTAHSRSFTYTKDRPISYFHRMQVGTYMYMLNSKKLVFDNPKERYEFPKGAFREARVLSISKDDLRMAEKQVLWDEKLENDVLTYWQTINKYWAEKKLPPCTCADHEGGFMANEKYNPYFYEGEPCSLAWYNKWKEENAVV